jgi:hypothetical protein
MKYEDKDLLRCDGMQFDREVPTFQINLLPPSSDRNAGTYLRSYMAYVPEDCALHIHYSENIRFHMMIN